MLSYRLADFSDLPLIVDTWVESYRTAHAAGPIPMPYYHEDMEKYVRWFLERPGVRAYVAHNPEVSAETRANVFGWIAVEDDIEVPQRVRIGGRWEERLLPAECPFVHYLYVKSVYRRQGIATGLMNAAGVDAGRRFLYGAKTPVVKKCRLFANGIWSPLAPRFPKN